MGGDGSKDGGVMKKTQEEQPEVPEKVSGIAFIGLKEAQTSALNQMTENKGINEVAVHAGTVTLMKGRVVWVGVFARVKE